MSDIKFGSLYCYPNMDCSLWPESYTPEILPNIPKATPFVALELTTPKMFTGPVLKVLTTNGEMGYIGYIPLHLKEVTRYE
jgi:hypothetical protein